MKPSKGEVVVIVLVIATLVYIGLAGFGNDRKRIATRMTEHGEKIIEIDRCFIHSGPYWLSKNYRIYQVTTEKGEYWIRFGLFTPDIEKKTESGYTGEKW